MPLGDEKELLKLQGSLTILLFIKVFYIYRWILNIKYAFILLSLIITSIKDNYTESDLSSINNCN